MSDGARTARTVRTVRTASERSRLTPALRLAALGLTLSALWALSLWGLTDILQPAGWWGRAVAATFAATQLTCLLVALPRATPALVVTLPALVGGLLLLGTAGTGRAAEWLSAPGEQWQGVQQEVLSGIAPIDPSAHFQDVLLLVVWLWSTIVLLVLTGFGRLNGAARPARVGLAGHETSERPLGVPHALTAALLIALPTLAVPLAIHHRLSPAFLLGAGTLIALVLWLAAPRVRLAGAVAAGCAVALAAGTLAVLPDRPDRIWNEAIQVAPVGGYVDDVTIELARSLGQRSPAPVFTYTGSEKQPVYFRLASLSTFDGGTWLPDDDLDGEGRRVSEQRSTVPPVPGGARASSAEVQRLAAGERDEWGRLVVETPAGNALFSPEEGQLVGFTPAFPEWQQLWFDDWAEGEQFVDVTISGLRSSWLPLPTGTTAVSRAKSLLERDDWVWAQQANTARSVRGMTETGDSFMAEVQPGGGVPPRSVLRLLPPELLRVFPDGAGAPADLRPFLELPGTLPPSMVALKERVEYAGLDRVSAASELEHYFRASGEFTYDESAPFLPGADPADPYGVMDALLTTGSGFCVHFATTFAVLARSLGVPTRVAVGYASRSEGPTPVTVRALDLHAWPEIYVDAVGWVPFEPTPGGAGVRAESPGARAAASGEPAAAPEDELSGRNTPLSTERPDAVDDAADPESGEAATPGEGSDSGALGRLSAPWLIAAALLVLTLLLGLAPGLVRLRRRSRRRREILRGSAPARAAWAELTDTLQDYSAPPGGNGGGPAAQPRAQTPEAIVAAIAVGGALASEESLSGAARLADAVVEERYAPAPAEPPGARSRERLVADLASCVAELRALAPRTVRIRARLLPASVLTRPPLAPTLKVASNRSANRRTSG